jgi:hypothetical protein
VFSALRSLRCKRHVALATPASATLSGLRGFLLSASSNDLSRRPAGTRTSESEVLSASLRRQLLLPTAKRGERPRPTPTRRRRDLPPSHRSRGTQRPGAPDAQPAQSLVRRTPAAREVDGSYSSWRWAPARQRRSPDPRRCAPREAWTRTWSIAQTRRARCVHHTMAAVTPAMPASKTRSRVHRIHLQRLHPSFSPALGRAHPTAQNSPIAIPRRR